MYLAQRDTNGDFKNKTRAVITSSNPVSCVGHLARLVPNGSVEAMTTTYLKARELQDVSYSLAFCGIMAMLRQVWNVVHNGGLALGRLPLPGFFSTPPWPANLGAFSLPYASFFVRVSGVSVRRLRQLFWPLDSDL